jgi:hypothetical protein
LARLSDGSPGKHCWHRPEAEASPTARMAFGVSREEDVKQTVYNARIPLAVLGVTPQHLKTGIRFSFLVNDNDGDAREGWMALSEGIGRGKDPSKYPVIAVPRAQ